MGQQLRMDGVYIYIMNEHIDKEIRDNSAL